MTADDKKLPRRSGDAEVDAFLAQMAAAPVLRAGAGRGRLIFAMDATASREPTWDRACHIQAQMFEETAGLGGLEIQLCFYRGYREFRASPWLSRTEDLQRKMAAVRCLGGYTQISRVLAHALAEANKGRVNALVFVGDCMEEDADELCRRAGELGMLGVPVFLFQEGDDPMAESCFRQIARLTRGAYCRFDAGSARQLRDLLSAVAVYAAGGRRALADFGRRQGGSALLLTRQLPPDKGR